MLIFTLVEKNITSLPHTTSATLLKCIRETDFTFWDKIKIFQDSKFAEVVQSCFDLLSTSFDLEMMIDFDWLRKQ